MSKSRSNPTPDPARFGHADVERYMPVHTPTPEPTGAPRQGSPEEINATALTNAALAWRIEQLQRNRRWCDKKTADAFLWEAAKRLRWSDVYDKHDHGNRR